MKERNVQTVRTLCWVVFGWSALISGEARAASPECLAKLNLSDLKRHIATLASDALEGRPAGQRGGKAASAYLISELKKLPLKPAGTAGQWVQEFGQDWRNVLALLPGSDPELADQLIVIGAHYDHVGLGSSSNSYGPLGHIHNGADDNASGTAAVLEIAEALCAQEPRPRCSILFAFWDAEELGLHGAQHWLRQPSLPDKTVRLMINLDMVGRLRNDRILVMGWRSAAGLREKVTRANQASRLNCDFRDVVTADSDHWPFYSASIPTLCIDTDKHEDYHRPSDDAEKLNYEGIHRIALLAVHLAEEASQQTEFPSFRPECFREKPADFRPPQQVATIPDPGRVGIGWNPRFAEKGILEVVTVVPNSAAAAAGVRVGDRILEFGSWKGGDLVDFRTVARVAVNPIRLVIQRPDKPEPQVTAIQLSGNAVRFGITWSYDPALPENAVVWTVVPFSPAHRAGLKPGDVLLSFAGEPIPDEPTFRQHLATAAGPFKMEIERQGVMEEIAAPLYEQAAVSELSDSP